MRKIMVDLQKCTGCRMCQIACAVRHSKSGNLYVAILETPRPRSRTHVKDSYRRPFPLRCEHCEEALCIDACKSGALGRDAETGAVRIDEDKCVGCWMCVMVCPFGAVFADFERGKLRGSGAIRGDVRRD